MLLKTLVQSSEAKEKTRSGQGTDNGHAIDSVGEQSQSYLS